MDFLLRKCCIDENITTLTELEAGQRQ